MGCCATTSWTRRGRTSPACRQASRRSAPRSGFVDVVGSTGLVTHLPLGDIGRAIASFEEHAANAVAASGGRVVKFIGDEVMFRVHDPAAACHVALTIVARFSDDEVLPGARAAVAFGDLLVRDGDYFGPVVNVAARATKLARPGTVLATASVGTPCRRPPGCGSWRCRRGG
jgi:class 3 adenylate cyclase